MRRILFTYCFLLPALFTVAQKQANAWYFGNKVGLDFNQSPPGVLTNGTIGSLEGCSSIADNNGKLLFYSNGVTIQNRKHQEMKNGNNLMGDLSSTNNTVIVPLPGNDSIYYLFTIGAQNQLSKGLRYNIINMKGDGGFGEVEQKNILIYDTTFEKLAAVKHCNKKDVWITVHKGNSDEYQSYLVTAAGVSTSPVISHTGFIPANPIGSLKFSADGKKLVGVYSFETNTVELMEFDNASGSVFNAINFQLYPVVISDELYIHAYGAEFSPNTNLLYISSNTSDAEPSTLFQFDITSGNAATILASKQIIAQTMPWYAGGLQLGPDQKIYMSMYKDTSLSVIENPDISGPGCNFSYNKIFLGINNSNAVQFGLPTFIQSYFDPKSNPYDFSRSGNCIDPDVSFTISRLTGIDSVKWDFGDGQKSQLLSPTHHFSSPGYYTVNLIVYKIDCSGLNDIISHTIWIAGTGSFLGADTGSCAVPSLQLGIDAIAGAAYSWNTGEVTNKITIAAFASYWLKIEQQGCAITDTINVFAKPKPVVNIGMDTTVCFYKPILLNATNVPGSTYLWNTGEKSPVITISRAGIYDVAVTSNSCVVSDTVTVSWGDCGVFVPSAFTPNNDGINDNFGVAAGFAAREFFMQVFDRWGNTVFITSNNTQKWDGKLKGKPVPAGGYTWIINYTDRNGYKNSLQGTVLLIR